MDGRYHWALHFLLALLLHAACAGESDRSDNYGRQLSEWRRKPGEVGSDASLGGVAVLPRVSPWVMFPGHRRAFETVLLQWGVALDLDKIQLEVELSGEAREDVWVTLEGPAAMPLGIPEEMLRLNATQDALLALSEAFVSEARQRGAWGLSEMQLNRTAVPRLELQLSASGDGLSGPRMIEGSVGLAQESYLRCKRTGEEPALFSPAALRLSAGPGGAAGRMTRREVMDLLDASRAEVVHVLSLRARGWCHEVTARIQNNLLSKVKVKVRAGTVLEHSSWNGQRGLAVARDVNITLGPAEGRDVPLPTVCTDSGGVLPIGPITLTPFAREDISPNQTVMFMQAGDTRGGTSSDSVLHAARLDAEEGGNGKLLEHVLQQAWAPAVDSLSRGTGLTALMEAARAGEYRVAALLLGVGKANTAVSDQDGMTALHHAVRGGVDEEGGQREGLVRVEAMRRLLSYGADVNAVDRYLWTPLMYATRALGARQHGAHHAALAVVEMLLQHKANQNVRDVHGNTALAWACWSSRAVQALEPLLQQCDLLGPRCAGIVNDANRLGMTPLMILSRVLDARAEHNGVQRTNASRSVTAAEMLLRRGAKVNLRSKNNETALIFAAEACNEDMVRILLDYGADATMRDARGLLAADRCGIGCEEVEALLREAQERAEGVFGGSVSRMVNSLGIAALGLLGWVRGIAADLWDIAYARSGLY